MYLTVSTNQRIIMTIHQGVDTGFDVIDCANTDVAVVIQHVGAAGSEGVFPEHNVPLVGSIGEAPTQKLKLACKE
jgi:hypothetical protein